MKEVALLLLLSLTLVQLAVAQYDLDSPAREFPEPKHARPFTTSRSQQERKLQATSPEDCALAVNRIKQDAVDYNEILKNYSLPNVTYTDPSFSWPYSIRWPNLPATASGADLSEYVEDEIDWLRVSEEFKAPKFTLWGNNGIRPEDAI